MPLPLKRDKRFHQGFYNPRNPQKYIGTGQIIYRSSIEAKFMRFCDDNPNVIKWGSENVIVEYYDTILQKKRKYYVDNFVVIKEGNVLKKYLIEIKPLSQTKKPIDTKKRKKAHLLYEQCAFETNMCKWKTANEYAKNIGAEFLLLAYSEKKGWERIFF